VSNFFSTLDRSETNTIDTQMYLSKSRKIKIQIQGRKKKKKKLRSIDNTNTSHYESVFQLHMEPSEKRCLTHPSVKTDFLCPSILEFLSYATLSRSNFRSIFGLKNIYRLPHAKESRGFTSSVQFE